MDEFAGIRHWTSGRQAAGWQSARGVMLGIGDDAAIVDTELADDGIIGGKRLVMAVDTMVESVHFNDATMRDEDIGYKALAVNVSDIAAMGGVPLHALVAVAVPPAYGTERMRRVYDGLYECAERFGVAVIGGDTTSAPEHLVITVTVTGTVEAGCELRRSGAKPGDAVFVTGAVGMSAAGLHLLQAEERERRLKEAVRAAAEQRVSAEAERGAGGAANAPEQLHADASADAERGAGKRGDAEQQLSGPALDERFASLVTAHRRPKPSVRTGRLLMELGVCHALNDVSDGLASEAWELAEASGLKLVLHERLLPKSGSLAAYASDAGVDPLEWMLFGGEDYVLVGTIAAVAVDEAKAAFHREGLPFFIIGETEAGEAGVELVRSQGWTGIGSEAYDAAKSLSASVALRQQIPKRGYNHFASSK